MSTVLTAGLAPLVCGHCGAPVVVRDADDAPCGHCGANTAVPLAHRQAVRLVASQQEEVRGAELAWTRFDRQTIPYSVVVAISTIPSVVLLAGLGFSLLAAMKLVETTRSPREMLGLTTFLPLVPCVGALTVAYWLSTSAAHALPLRISLAADLGKVPCCRLCGAALPITTGVLASRCVYCRADNLVTVDAMQARALAKNIEVAQASLAEALDAAARRRAKALWAGRWMVVVWLGLVALPVAWAFVPLLDGIGILVVIDFFALAMLTLMATVGTISTAIERSGRPAKGLNGFLALLTFGLAIAGSAALAWMSGQSPH